MKLLAFVLALLPILWLMLALGVLKKPAFKACPIALAAAILLALTYWKMPMKDCVTGGLEGVAMAIWPVSLVIIAAVFTYNLCIATGSMEKIKKVLTGVSKDRRILLLLIGWGFGGFLEGMAGFGTAVAIPAGILCGLGFSPIPATVACLVANATPTAFGSVGIPTVTLAQLTEISQGSLAWNTTVQLLPLILITPFVMVIIEGKSVRALKGIWPITLASGIAFAVPELLAAKFLGAELPVIIGSVCSMAVTILMARKNPQSREKEYLIGDKKQEEICQESENRITIAEAVKACIPFILIFVFLLLTSSMVPPLHDTLGKIKTVVQIYSGKGGTPYTFTWVATPGVLILLAAVIGGKIQGADISLIGKVFKDTCRQMWKTMVTIMSIMAMAKIMSHSGMIAEIAGMLVTLTGDFYPAAAPFVGAIGTFVTGSGTSANVLFGGLQVETAGSLGLDPCWLAGANTVGATIGKMISPQSIAIGTAATATVGNESKILRKVMKYCAIFIVIAGCVAYAGSRMR